jgi:hypothetical protein
MNHWQRAIHSLVAASLGCVLLVSFVDQQAQTKELYAANQTNKKNNDNSVVINLNEVDKALAATASSDLSSWMSAFEKRVNEIYEGKGIVSINLSSHDAKLRLLGFLESNGQTGFQESDQKLFVFQQSGAVADNALPFNLYSQQGKLYKSGNYSLHGKPVLHLVLGSLRVLPPQIYRTTPTRIKVLRTQRDAARANNGLPNR